MYWLNPKIIRSGQATCNPACWSLACLSKALPACYKSSPTFSTPYLYPLLGPDHLLFVPLTHSSYFFFNTMTLWFVFSIMLFGYFNSISTPHLLPYLQKASSGSDWEKTNCFYGGWSVFHHMCRPIHLTWPTLPPFSSIKTCIISHISNFNSSSLLASSSSITSVL